MSRSDKEDEPVQLSNIKLEVNDAKEQKKPSEKKMTLILARLKPETKPEEIYKLFSEKELPTPAEITMIEKDKALTILGLDKGRRDVEDSASVVRRRKKLENFAGEDSAFACLRFESREDSKSQHMID